MRWCLLRNLQNKYILAIRKLGTEKLCATTTVGSPSSCGPPKPPDESLCCETGCSNCVWIEYGDNLIEYYKDKIVEDAIKDVEKMIQNPVVRVFVVEELKKPKEGQ